MATTYEPAAADPAVASYFVGHDLEEIQLKFLATTMLVAGTGVTVGLVQRTAAAHARITNGAGIPITDKAFDKIVAALVATSEAEAHAGDARTGGGPVPRRCSTPPRGPRRGRGCSGSVGEVGFWDTGRLPSGQGPSCCSQQTTGPPI